MAGFPCWEPLEKQFSVATELGADHIGNGGSQVVLKDIKVHSFQVTSLP